VRVRPNLFDARIAAGYDASTDIAAPAFVDPAVDFLAGLAGDGGALEFAIGTGRIALPLRHRGVPVEGIDLSPDMVAVLQGKPGSEDIGVTVGDIATDRAGRGAPFRLVYLVYNTIENLRNQDDQVSCFCNAARHLEPGGFFVIEVEVPPLRRLPPGDTVRAFLVRPDHLGFDEFDVAAQLGVSYHYMIAGDRCEHFATPYRFVWPSELDLMARIAGMELRERWGDWDRRPFTSESPKHVSVWQKAA
jgi:SAM-dependent methyltransferase